jgi:glycerol-3-phosphate O-acyltransferase
MDENDLIEQIELSKRILSCEPYGPRVTVTAMDARAVIAYGEDMGAVTRTKHPLGDVLSMPGETAVLQSYFKNNILHLFSAAAWIALCFQNNRRLSRHGLVSLGLNVYPFMKSELFLPWNDVEFAERLNRTIDLFIREGFLTTNGEDSETLYRAPGQTDEVFHLRAIAHSMQQAFERYFIAITTLVKNGSGALSASELESLCHLTAQRLSLLYAPAAPEFFDKSLFRGFIANMREQKLIWLNEAGKLEFDQRLNDWEQDARLVLNRELRHTIHKISPDAAAPKAETPESGV